MILSLPVITLLLGGLASTAICQQAAPAAPSQVIRMDVRLVVLYATVSDSQGNAVRGLGKHSFRLFVDDQPYLISAFQSEDAPVAAGIIVDNSVSMAPVRSDVIAAALAFSRSSNPLDEMFVVHFNDRARLGLPSDKPFTGNVSELDAALSRFSPGGSTALYDAAGLALAHIEKATIPRRVLLILSDGGDNSSHTSPSAVLSWAQKAGVAIYCIGLFDEEDRDRKPGVLKQLSEATGGKAFFPSDVADITRICIEIAKEIRNQYALGFKGAEDGKYHRIRLIAEDAGRGPLTVHTRTGYTSEKPSSIP